MQSSMAKTKKATSETISEAVYAAVADLEDASDAQLIAYASERCGKKSPRRSLREH